MLSARTLSPILVPDSTRIRSPIARELRSLIARDDSQLFPRCSCEASTAQSSCQRIDRNGSEVETLDAVQAALDHEPITGQFLAADDLPEIVGEVFKRREAAGFAVKMDEVKAPAAVLAPAVLAYAPIEAALQAAGEPEIRPVDGERERFVQNAGVEPIRQNQLKPEGPAVRIGLLFPFIDPGETMPPALG